ncbi:MAG: sulfite exporter TauE/SafE family protein [Cytophagaceae bacterium]|nr:sulfite exporter TauE/SafE family protein [Cytophagaceae bacterium]
MLLSGILLFLFSFLAFSLSAVCGGGASFILIPALNWVLPGAQIPAALSIGTASSSVSRILLFFRNIRWSIVIWFVPPAIPAVWLGSWLLTSLNPFYLELILGLFLLSNLPLIFKSKKESSIASHMPKVYLLLIGLTAGFVSGLTGAVGLLFNRFYLRYGLSKEEIVATRAANELLLHCIKLVLYASFGLLTQHVLLFGFIIAVAAILSSIGVKRILPYISEQLFQRLGYSAMVISGMAMFSNATANLVHQNKASLSYQSADKGIDMKMQWKKSTFELELEYDEGFELEYPIQQYQIPLKQQQEISEIARGADKLVLEEVYGVNKHYYEAYVYKGGKLDKYSIYP